MILQQSLGMHVFLIRYGNADFSLVRSNLHDWAIVCRYACSLTRYNNDVLHELILMPIFGPYLNSIRYL